MLIICYTFLRGEHMKTQDEKLKHSHNNFKHAAIPRAMLVVILLLTIYVRLRLMNVPLERDEGEYAYAGQLLLQGVPPYSMAYNMKMPGIYGVYAVIMSIFGQSCCGIHTGLMVANVLCALLLLAIGRKLFDELTAIYAAACFSLLSVDINVLGASANAEHFVILFALAGILMLLYAGDTGRGRLSGYFTGGVLLGLGIIVKQQGSVFAAAGLLYIFCNHIFFIKPRSLRIAASSGAWYLAGILTPLILTAAALLKMGVFDKFWFWTFQYAAYYASAVQFTFPFFKNSFLQITSASWPLWVIAGMGILPILAFKDGLSGITVLLLTIFSAFGVSIGNYYREHYFILVLPAIALLFGIAVINVGRNLNQDLRMRDRITVIITFAALLSFVIGQRNYLFKDNPSAVCRASFPGNLFIESLPVADYIRAHTKEDDRIAVIGSEPQIYFYADRRSATGYIYTYPLMQLSPFSLQMQKEMISQIETASPEMLVRVNVPLSWLKKKGSHNLIFNWFDDYAQKYYDLVGVVKSYPNNGQASFFLGRENFRYLPSDQRYSYDIYKKRTLKYGSKA